MCEIRRGEEWVALNSGHSFYYKGPENESRRRLGFLVNKKLAPNVIKFDIIKFVILTKK